jgi:hypothetical protein
MEPSSAPPTDGSLGPNPTPSELVEVLDGILPEIVGELIEELRGEWPTYAAFLDAHREDTVEPARLALRRLVANVARGDVHVDATDSVVQAFEEVGRLEARAGRELSSLLAAYRLGARTAWRHLARSANAWAVPGPVLAAIAEAVFLIVDELSSTSAQGYLDEQRRSVDARERHRAELVDLLFTADAGSARLRRVATAAAWPLPDTACLVLTRDEVRSADLISIRLGSAALPIRRGGASGVVLPNPRLSSRRALLARLLTGTGAVVGLEVELAGLTASLGRVLHAVSLAQRGVLGADPLFLDEHLAMLLVHSDEDLLAQLVARALRPLDELPPGPRRRLTETLKAWLDTTCDTQRTARLLRVHPHTVHYRLAQLRHHFGNRLDDADARLELAIALRSDLAAHAQPNRRAAAR